LSGDSLRERPLQDAVIGSGRPDHVPADERYRRCIAHLLTSWHRVDLSDIAPDRAGQSSSAAVASVHRSSSARSEATLRQTANAPTPSAASTMSFFTARNPPPR